MVHILSTQYDRVEANGLTLTAVAQESYQMPVSKTSTEILVGTAPCWPGTNYIKLFLRIVQQKSGPF